MSDDLGMIWIDRAVDSGGGPVGGTVMHNVQAGSACAGRGCWVHHPSGHHMAAWPVVWRDDLRIAERLCPHGVGHPDPDDAAYRESVGSSGTVHGCDGCCVPD